MKIRMVTDYHTPTVHPMFHFLDNFIHVFLSSLQFQLPKLENGRFFLELKTEAALKYESSRLIIVATGARLSDSGVLNLFPKTNMIKIGDLLCISVLQFKKNYPLKTLV